MSNRTKGGRRAILGALRSDLYPAVLATAPQSDVLRRSRPDTRPLFRSLFQFERNSASGTNRKPSKHGESDRTRPGVCDLITRRSRVRIPPPLLQEALLMRGFFVGGGPRMPGFRTNCSWCRSLASRPDGANVSRVHEAGSLSTAETHDLDLGVQTPAWGANRTRMATSMSRKSQDTQAVRAGQGGPDTRAPPRALRPLRRRLESSTRSHER